MADEWFRGDAGARTQLRNSIVDEDAKDRDELFNRLYLGTAALKVMRGVAERDEVRIVIGQMIADCEIEVQQCAQAMLAEPDSGSPAARQAHFRGRVAAGILGKINAYIEGGHRAADTLDPRHSHGE